VPPLVPSLPHPGPRQPPSWPTKNAVLEFMFATSPDMCPFGSPNRVITRPCTNCLPVCCDFSSGNRVRGLCGRVVSVFACLGRGGGEEGAVPPKEPRPPSPPSPPFVEQTNVTASSRSFSSFSVFPGQLLGNTGECKPAVPSASPTPLPLSLPCWRACIAFRRTRPPGTRPLARRKINVAHNRVPRRRTDKPGAAVSWLGRRESSGGRKRGPGECDESQVFGQSLRAEPRTYTRSCHTSGRPQPKYGGVDDRGSSVPQSAVGRSHGKGAPPSPPRVPTPLGTRRPTPPIILCTAWELGAEARTRQGRC
jgi:hypothetical protein